MKEALGIDHAGYVLKTNAATELLEAIEAARRNPKRQTDQAVLDCAVSSFRTRNSVSAVTNLVKPQSKQTRRVGNAKTVGIVRSLFPGKWMLISLGNAVWFSDLHDLQLSAPSLD